MRFFCLVMLSAIGLGCTPAGPLSDAGVTVDGGVDTGTDAGAVEDAGVKRYCSKPTSGKYAFTMGAGRSALYLVGSDGWVAKLGDLVVGPTDQNVQLDSVTQNGTALEGTAGPFLYDIPTSAPTGSGRITMVPRASYVGTFNYASRTYFDQGTFIGASQRDVYCGTASGAFGLGLGSTLPCTTITAIRGTCGLTTSGDYQAKAVASCGGASRYVEMSQTGQVPTQVKISESLPGRFRGLTHDSLTTDGTGDVYLIGVDGLTKRFTTKLCVEEFSDNPFNGTTQSLTEIVD